MEVTSQMEMLKFQMLIEPPSCSSKHLKRAELEMCKIMVLPTINNANYTAEITNYSHCTNLLIALVICF